MNIMKLERRGFGEDQKRGGRLGGSLRVTATMRLGGAVQGPVGDVPGTLRRGVHGEAPAPLPSTLPGSFINVKYLTRFRGASHLRLARFTETFGVMLEGRVAHQAGIDALISALVFEVQMERLWGREEEREGILHGIEEERFLLQSSEETEQEELLLILVPAMLIGMSVPLPGFYVLE
ncbi:unnamed protein product [Spirodela intermedia]|uniref:Uncharacterized protein n=1 Tax=Spirodela intermedia TaxID=51605 RepID=A0A7I8IJ78_SPIIN|nr:unnamed protein product [Spirodela intermedia]CAA6657949.1 unnamed protein product [Spirodela intermedia]